MLDDLDFVCVSLNSIENGCEKKKSKWAILVVVVFVVGDLNDTVGNGKVVTKREKK